MDITQYNVTAIKSHYNAISGIQNPLMSNVFCEVNEMSRQNLHSLSAYQMQTQCGLSFGLVAPGGANTEGDILGPMLAGTSGQWQDPECSYLPDTCFLKK